jgi:hypothetical protein
MNRSGQALIEMLVLSSIAIVSVLLIVRLGFILQMNIAIDEMIETTHLCELQKKNNCRSELLQKLSNIGIIENSLVLSKTTDRSNLRLSADTSLGHTIFKESELYLGLSVP